MAVHNARLFDGRNFTLGLAIVALLQAHAIANPRCSCIELHSHCRFAKGEQQGASESNYDDSASTVVHVPHDSAIAGPFDSAENGYAAKLPWRGVGWYRRSFTLDCELGDRVYLDFDGVMAFPKVYINGKLAGEWDYGYTSFRIDATSFVNLKGRNVLAIRADTTNHGTRWYPGAGIYRKVTLQIRKPIHLAHWGTAVTTPTITADVVTVKVRTTVENHTDETATVGVDFRFCDPAGAAVGDVADSLTIPASGSKELEISTPLRNPQRWDVETPRLYTVQTAIVPSAWSQLNLWIDGDQFTSRVVDFHLPVDATLR